MNQTPDEWRDAFQTMLDKPDTPALTIIKKTKKSKAKKAKGQKTKKQATHRLWRPEHLMLHGGLVTISTGLSWYLKLHARRWKPAESCAMLFGRKDDKSKKFDILGAVLCSNPTHSGGYFEIPPIEVIKSFEIAKKHGMEIVGVFHSHPSNFEVPSTTDHEFMQVTPGAWIIYSWTAFRCYTLKQNEIKELKVKEIRTVPKPIIEYAFNWKTTRFPPKPKPFRWSQRWGREVLPISQVRRVEEPIVWPPDWESQYGIGYPHNY